MKKRQHIFFIGFVIIFFTLAEVLNKFNQESILYKTHAKNEFKNTVLKKRNEAVLVKTLLLNKWISIQEIHKSSYKDIRNTIILEIENRTGIFKQKLNKLSDDELSSTALVYQFFLESNIKPVDSLKFMYQQDLKMLLVKINKEHTSYSISDLKKFSINKNLQIAYQWWLPKNNAALINKINTIDFKNAHFQVKDNHNRNTEVLRIVKADEHDFKYLGVYHSMVSKNGFKLFLAGSNDLKSWTRITNLGNRSHQADIKKWGDGYLLVNEEDKKEGSNNIQIRFYESYNDLCANLPKNNISLNRTFSRYAEGTPDIREIVGKHPEDSHLLLGFHYFNKGDVDYQAIGILKNFKHWKAWKDNITNTNIINMGFKGNIGGRYSFNVSDETYILQEAQIKKNDFSSWQLLLGNDAFYSKLNLKTPKKSTSFANPSITEIEKGTYAISTFLPSEGNKRGENGQLIYTFKLVN